MSQIKPEIRITRSDGDYLKAIYRLTRAADLVSTQELANYLSVAPASVTGMLRKLSQQQPKLIEYTHHRGAGLTLDGEQAALRIIRRHRLIELFLMQILDYTWDEVHSEAEELEHVITPQFEDRLANLLGEPDFDPHGEPIPGRDLQLPSQDLTTLDQLEPGQTSTIMQVESHRADLLHYLGSSGILPDTPIQVITRNPFDGTLHLLIGDNDRELILGDRLTRLIFVKNIHQS